VSFNKGTGMKNRDIYLKDPSDSRLINLGVANVNDDRSASAMSVLRYELETFVCDGQYKKGLQLILETFLKNVSQPQQPAVWVSGFYGSGKSHLIKMLRALWEDTVFSDGASARGIANLPLEVKDCLKELSVQGKRHGGLHAVSGTLGAGAQDKTVRMALLSLIFRSVGLPEQYNITRFMLWLKKEGISEQVKNHVMENGYDWEEEIADPSVAEGIYAALCDIRPGTFSRNSVVTEVIPKIYPIVNDVSAEEMLSAIRLALTKDNQFPLTLIVLDEVQQYIGEDAQRSIEVQEAVESCCKNIGGKLLFIGTGQTAITGTSNLKKLEGRFTVRVELSDADVEAVIRQVVLAKKPEAKAEIMQVMDANIGEISRHLKGSAIGHNQKDRDYFSLDYPVLPVRRRLWELIFRALDQTGTDSQLRNQLSMIHKLIQTSLEKPLGHVIAADHLYFDAADKLLQTRILPRRLYDATKRDIEGNDDEKLRARASGLIFLLNRLCAANHETGLKTTIDTLADLMVENLNEGSAELRKKLPLVLSDCQQLMKVGDEYRIQTEESTAWNDDYAHQRQNLNNDFSKIDHEREERIKKHFEKILPRKSLSHGKSKVERTLYPVFDAGLPNDAGKKICIWLRSAWSCQEKSVQVEAGQAGNDSPVIFVFIPKGSGDELRHNLIDFKAASITLEKKGLPNTAEGKEARLAMETIQHKADERIEELLAAAFQGVRVFQGGGSEISGNNLKDMIFEAAENSLLRLYPQFAMADNANWHKVYENAKKGSPEPLKAIGDSGPAHENPVCKAILSFIGNGKNGQDIRNNFENPPYGWSRDAVDGGLQSLLVTGHLLAGDERGQRIEAIKLERRDISKISFKAESVTLETKQRIAIRGVMQKLQISCKPGLELDSMLDFLQQMQKLRASAGGEPPLPARPAAEFLAEIARCSGNEQLLAVFERKDQLNAAIEEWQKTVEQIKENLPLWQNLQKLLAYAEGLAAAENPAAQAQTIEKSRLMLESRDTLNHLISELTGLLRTELNELKEKWEKERQRGESRLAEDENWQQLAEIQQQDLLIRYSLTAAETPQFKLESTEKILETLGKTDLSSLKDRIDAMSGRYEKLLSAAAKLLEPEIQEVCLPGATLKDKDDIEEWLDDVRNILISKINIGPIRV
jgi:hypothetical protein